MITSDLKKAIDLIHSGISYSSVHPHFLDAVRLIEQAIEKTRELDKRGRHVIDWEE